METKNFKLIISYDGTAYCGWQVQESCPSVQGKIEEALFTIFKTPISLKYSSRTDSGVHAFGQVASFIAETSIGEENLRKALNSMLPHDIAVVSVKSVSPDFDARKVIKKTYKYIIKNSRVRDPLNINRVWWVPYKLDVELMYKASREMIGKRDFKSFMSHGSKVKTTIRNILDLNITITQGHIIIDITANGFLKQMVRNIVGTLVDVARGRIPVESVKGILEAGDRKMAGVTAPACGLYLEKVYYAGD
jgi:tRNA pseudouridine38-40 synthase